MPRPARVIVPGYPYHLTHRGNNKQDIFHSDDDRRIYLYWFEEVRKKHDVKVLAYCLMDNHIHFVAIAKNEDSFARVIGATHTRYAIYFNQKYGNVGHLWQGRYYSGSLKENHLIAAVRYVERNPVRAQVVNKPWDWVWSSAREHMEVEKSIILLENVRPFFDLTSWKEYIDQPDKEEDIKYIKLGRPTGRPKKGKKGTVPFF